jgi:hypothetical protein
MRFVRLDHKSGRRLVSGRWVIRSPGEADCGRTPAVQDIGHRRHVEVPVDLVKVTEKFEDCPGARGIRRETLKNVRAMQLMAGLRPARGLLRIS